MEKTYLFHVTGMHCNACILMTESELRDVPSITHASSSLVTHTVEVTGDFGDKDATVIASELTAVLAKHGYALSVEKPRRDKEWRDFRYAVPIAMAFMALFIALQKAGLVNLITASSVSYGTAFLIGMIASLSSCMAVVGGLVLSMSATFAKEGDAVRPQALFHVGRIAAFFVFGAALGAAGSAFQLNASVPLVLGIAVGIIMLLLGINLLDVFDWAKRFQPAMPRFLSRHALGISKLNHRFTPFLVGVATFFLPCGFTQSMQLTSLTTGSAAKGGLLMLAFALGTFPVLALISFSSFSVDRSSHKGVFFKTAGLIVILFAIFNIANGLAAAGIIRPLFNL